MQLCTNARIFLDMVAASGQPKLWELTPPEARQKVIELTRMVECEEAIGKIEDRTLPGPTGPLAELGYWVTLIRMTACAAFSLMKVAADLFQSIIASRLSIRSLLPLKMLVLQQNGLRLIRRN